MKRLLPNQTPVGPFSPTARLGQNQRGAALLTAMIIVTLVATLAASMVWQQWRAVQVEAAERDRTQSAWILAGALDWARLILSEDNRTTDHLGEPWAVPLAEARLSTFLAADQSNTDDGPEAFLSGTITDAQARYNLMNLIKAEDGTADPEQVKVLIRLCEAINVSGEVATRIASGLANAIAPKKEQAKEAAAPLIPRTVSQLSWLGIPPDAIQALTPYVVLLEFPSPVKVNLNTASREVIAAAGGIDVGRAERLVQTRQREPFTAATMQKALSEVDGKANLGITSSFFEVRGRLRLGTRVLEQISLVQRAPTGRNVVVLRRERVSSLDQPAS
jgi:general secretion pathway protein K